MKAQYISTPGRAKKIIAAVWVAAISLSSVIVPFVNGVSVGNFEHKDYSIFIFNLLTKLYFHNNSAHQWYSHVFRYFL